MPSRVPNRVPNRDAKMSEEALPATSPGSPSGTPPAPGKSVLRRVAGLLRDVFGKPRFDDRIDTQPDIRTAAALVIISRSAQLLAEVKGLFMLKALLQLLMIFPGLLLPWMAKIVVDNVMLQQPFGQTEVLYPPFMYPILDLVEGRDPLGIMLTLTTLYFVMLLIAGSRMDGIDAGLLEGRDAATQAENRISAGNSDGGGLLGLVEFMAHVRLTQSIANRLRSRLFDRLTRLPMTVLDDQRAGDSVFRVLYDTPLAPELAYRVTLAPFFMLLGALINLYVLQYSYGDVSPQLVVIAWLAAPAAFLVTFPFSGALRRNNQNMRAAGSATTNAMEESMSNIAAIQSLGAGKEENRRFAERSSETFLRERYAILVNIVASAIAGAVFGIAAIYLTILISDGVIEGSMSPGDFAVLLGIYWSISIAAGYFGAWWIKLQDTIAAVRRVFFFLDHPSEHERLGGVVLDDIRRGVELEGVGFSYPDGQEALRDIDLKLPLGELVAIVGPTGAGKTTLAYLVPSLLTPTTGRVRIDGRDATELDVDSLRHHVTYVFQEHVLLSETIRENLLLANPQATEAQMAAALETAGCMDFINDLTDGIDTKLGRSGDSLSVGQQQRLSIARGLVRDAKILILDEPTAALDPQTENALVTSLRSAAQERLVIVIAHRLSTIRHADRIVFLEDGEIRDLGSHDELMARPESAYRDFVEMQRGRREVTPQTGMSRSG